MTKTLKTLWEAFLFVTYSRACLLVGSLSESRTTIKLLSSTSGSDSRRAWTKELPDSEKRRQKNVKGKSKMSTCTKVSILKKLKKGARKKEKREGSATSAAASSFAARTATCIKGRRSSREVDRQRNLDCNHMKGHLEVRST